MIYAIPFPLAPKLLFKIILVTEKQTYEYVTAYTYRIARTKIKFVGSSGRPTSGYVSLMFSLPLVPLLAQFPRQVPVLKHYRFPNNYETKETCFPDLDLPMTKTCEKCQV